MPKQTGNATMSMGSPEVIDYRLKQEEQLINLKILHKMDRESCAKKQNRFRRTVLAVYNIVSQKLYKRRASSVEVYFREAWRISRAQVYRFLDCAEVLKQLEDFPEQPCKERLCRSLKRLAHNRDNIRILWVSVLKRVTSSNQTVTSTVISSVWEELLKNRLVSVQKDTKTRKGYDKLKSISSNCSNKYLKDKNVVRQITGTCHNRKLTNSEEAHHDMSNNVEWNTFQLSSSEDCNGGKSMPLNGLVPGNDMVDDVKRPQNFNGSLGSTDPLQEMMNGVNVGKCSPVIPQWSNKSLCSVESLYHRGGNLDLNLYTQHDHKLSYNQSSPSAPYSIDPDSYWDELRNFQTKDSISQNDLVQSESNSKPYSINDHVFAFSHTTEPHIIQSLVPSPLHHSQVKQTSPMLLGGTQLDYKSPTNDSIWLLQNAHPVQNMLQTPQLENTGSPQLDQLSHYCQPFTHQQQSYPCKTHVQIKNPQKHKDLQFCDICCTSLTHVLTNDQQKPTPNSILCSGNSSWLSDHTQEYLILQKTPQLVAQNQTQPIPIDALSTDTATPFSPVQMLHKTDQPYNNLIKLSYSPTHHDRTLSHYRHIIPPSSIQPQPVSSCDIPSSSWNEPIYSKSRTSMDQCGRTSFSDFCSNDALLYCNN